MNLTLKPGPLTGAVTIPASKSQAHRQLICAALGRKRVTLRCDGLSRDIRATMACLEALGAEIAVVGDTITVTPVGAPKGPCRLPCGESGSTLRFLLPVAAALGVEASFLMEGRLPQRPMEALEGQLVAHGVDIGREGDTLTCRGRLRSGEFTLPGNVSSQYISGLLFALPLLDGDSTLTVTGTVESAAYIAMTEDALRLSGVRFEKKDNRYVIPGGQVYVPPADLQVEGDWSNAAFFLSMGALGGEITVRGLNLRSAQGDRAVLEVLRAFGAEVHKGEHCVTVRHQPLHGITIDAAPIPDLVPVLSVVASAAAGETRIINAGRLRLKESDRLTTTARLLTALGGCVEELPEGLVIRGTPLAGGVVDACGDHRIAMSAAVAARLCSGAVTVEGCECVEKSYPRFWEHLEALKGASV